MRAFYIVGGYVRDRLLGRETKDHDFVVVGSTPEEMMALGFQRVGSHFPVFLNKAGDEYALARTEVKTGPGYNGFDVHFDPSVTLEEDLLRRDLTINAMARQVVDWNDQGHAMLSDDIIDPHNGQADLRAGILRHVSVAFREDPVRVLRVARFKARYNFTVAPETQDLMKQIVQAGEVDHLVAERVWQEMEGALMEKHPTQFFWELQSCGAMAIMFPYLRSAVIHRGRALERAALLDHDLPIRFSLLCSLLTREQIDSFCFTYRVPNELKTFALATVAMVEFVGTEATADQTLALLSDLGAWQNPSVMVVAARAIAMLASDTEMRRLDRLLRAHRAAFPVKFVSLPAEQQATLKGKDIGQAIAAVRLKLIEQA